MVQDPRAQSRGFGSAPQRGPPASSLVPGLAGAVPGRGQCWGRRHRRLEVEARGGGPRQVRDPHRLCPGLPCTPPLRMLKAVGGQSARSRQELGGRSRALHRPGAAPSCSLAQGQSGGLLSGRQRARKRRVGGRPGTSVWALVSCCSSLSPAALWPWGGSWVRGAQQARQDQSASASGKHVAEQGRGLRQVEGRERAGGGGPGREDHGPGPAGPWWAGPAPHRRGPRAGSPRCPSREQGGSGDPGRPPPGPGLGSTSASLFWPRTPRPFLPCSQTGHCG